jgi:hypothetical protein
LEVVNICAAHNTSWVASILVGIGSIWEERALWLFLLIFYMSLQGTISKYWLCSSLWISLRVLPHKSSIAFLLTDLVNISQFKPNSPSLSRLFVTSNPANL